MTVAWLSASVTTVQVPQDPSMLASSLPPITVPPVHGDTGISPRQHCCSQASGLPPYGLFREAGSPHEVDEDAGSPGMGV